MCKWGTTRKVNVIRRNNPSVEDGWHEVSVDSCIANIVQEMNDKGIVTMGCCCGHGNGPGHVLINKCSEILLKKYNYKYENATSEVVAYPFNTLIVFTDDVYLGNG